MKRDVFLVSYVAFCVFTSVFLVASYIQSLANGSTEASFQPVAVYRTLFVVEFKYTDATLKPPTFAFSSQDKRKDL